MGAGPSLEGSESLADMEAKVQAVNKLFLRKELPLVLELTLTEEVARWKSRVDVVVTNSSTQPQQRRLLDFDAFHAFFEFLRESVSRSVTPGASTSGSEPDLSGETGEARLKAFRASDGVATVTPGELSERECCVCLDRDSEIMLPCLHAFCERCIREWADRNEKCAECPICRTPIASTAWADSWQLVEETPLLQFVWGEIDRRAHKE
jgi:hypothetical protein